MNRRKTIAIASIIGAAIAILIAKSPVSAQEPHAVSGAALFASNCAACHGSDGRSGERAPDIATRSQIVSLSDADLIRIVQNGLPGSGMPPFGYLGPEKVHAIVTHLRTLQGVGAAVKVPGDPRAGERLFFAKAECSHCHAVDGRGGFLASDLSGYGRGHSAEEIRAAITDPDRKLDRAKQSVTIVSIDGKRSTGFIRSEDNFSLVLLMGNGAYHFFSRDRIARVEYSGRSTMPRDYEARLTGKELDDLVSYLLTAGTAEKKAAEDDDD